jgi:hypothetical protein
MTTRFAALALVFVTMFAFACGGSQSGSDPAPIGNKGGDTTAPGGGADMCADTLPASYEPVTANDVLANPQSYDGRDVVITGYLRQGPAICTEMACSADDPCCNACNAAMVIDQLEIQGLGCGGDSCKLECNAPDGANVQLWGTITWDGYGPRFEKQDLCTL